MQETSNEITLENSSPRLFRQLEMLQSHMQDILLNFETRLARCEKAYEELRHRELGRKSILVADVDERLNGFWETMPELASHKEVAASQSTLEKPPASALEQVPSVIEEVLEEPSTKVQESSHHLQDVTEHDFDAPPETLSGMHIGIARSIHSETDQEFFRNVDICTFDRNIWDASFFINLQSNQILITVYAAFLLLLNLVLQCMFTLITMWYLAPTDITHRTVVSLKKWRMHFGHSFQYSHMGYSLAARVCSGDESLEISGHHQSLLERINRYVPNDPVFWATGPILCCIAMLCWSLTATVEFRKTLMFSIRFWHIPQGARTEIDLGTNSKQLTQLHPKRFVFVQILCFVRCAISILILGSGLAWLAHTTGIGDLVLNAVALEFVFSLDERLYEAAAPVGLQRFIEMGIIVPRHITRITYVWGLKTPLWQVRIILTPIVVFCASLACVGLSIPVFLAPVTSTLLDARAALCAGNLDFVISHTNAHPFWGWSQTLPYPANGNDQRVIDMRSQWKAITGHDKFLEEIASNLILNLRHMPSVVSTLYPNLMGRDGSLQAVSKQDSAEANYLTNRNCQDFKPSDFSRHSWVAMVSRFHWRPNLERPCNDPTWAEYCFWPNDLGDAARMFCPELCGCSTPASAQVLQGCPHQCQWLSTYTTALNEKDCCTDSPKATLIASMIWIEVVKNFKSARFSYKERVAMLIEKAADLLANHGCDGIKLARSSHGLDMCDELTGLPGLLQFRYWCPVACSCEESLARGCPTLRRKNPGIQAQMPAIKNHTNPNGVGRRLLSNHSRPLTSGFITIDSPLQHIYSQGTTVVVAPSRTAMPTPSAVSTPVATPARTRGAPVLPTPLPIPATMLASTPLPTAAPTLDLSPALMHAMTQPEAPVPATVSTSAQHPARVLAAAVSTSVPTSERATARLWDLTTMPTATTVSKPTLQALTPTMLPASAGASMPAPTPAPTATIPTISTTNR